MHPRKNWRQFAKANLILLILLAGLLGRLSYLVIQGASEPAPPGLRSTLNSRQ